jgi:hypothetical protein
MFLFKLNEIIIILFVYKITISKVPNVPKISHHSHLRSTPWFTALMYTYLLSTKVPFSSAWLSAEMEPIPATSQSNPGPVWPAWTPTGTGSISGYLVKWNIFSTHAPILFRSSVRNCLQIIKSFRMLMISLHSSMLINSICQNHY